MSRATLNLTPALYEYLLEVSLRDDPLLKRLRDETGKMAQANMQIAPEQGQFMALLVKLLGARRCIEVGTFTGYSALCIARALPADGHLVACDVSEEWTSIARRHWQESGVAGKIHLRVAPAAETLHALIDEGQEGQYDFAFIDANKTAYAEYYELCLRLLRAGGLIAVDNTLWGGAVANPRENDADTRALRAFNLALRDDARIEPSLVPIGDGLTLARKV